MFRAAGAPAIDPHPPLEFRGDSGWGQDPTCLHMAAGDWLKWFNRHSWRGGEGILSQRPQRLRPIPIVVAPRHFTMSLRFVCLESRRGDNRQSAAVVY